MSVRTQGTILFAAILLLVASAVVVQLWLLTVSMEALLGGEYKTYSRCVRVNRTGRRQRRIIALRLSV